MTAFLAPTFAPQHASVAEVDLRDPDVVGAQICRRGVTLAGVLLTAQSLLLWREGTTDLFELGVLIPGLLLLISSWGLTSRRVRGSIARTAQPSTLPTAFSIIGLLVVGPFLFVGGVALLIVLAVVSAPAPLDAVPVGVMAAVGVAVTAAGVASSRLNQPAKSRAVRCGQDVAGG